MHFLRPSLSFSPVNNFVFEVPDSVGVAVPGPVISASGIVLSCA